MAEFILDLAAARDIGLFDFCDLTNQKAVELLARIRWGNSTTQTCPSCGAVDSHYYRRHRFQWRCKHCDLDFSVTTSTVFQDRKISLRKLLVAIFIYAASANGVASKKLAEQVGISRKSGFVLTSKLREVLVRNANLEPLQGHVQVDGAYFCGKPHKPNRRRKISGEEVVARLSAKKGGRASKPPKTRMSRRSIEKLKNRRVILVAREVSPIKGVGGLRTIASVVLHENAVAAMSFIQRTVAPGATIWTDECSAYSELSQNYQHETVNHSLEFVGNDGVNDNQCESFNSRMRRAEYGIFHGFRPKYLSDYLWEAVWRDDNRKATLRTKFLELLTLVLTSGRSLWWRGYCQRQHRDGELLFTLGHRESFANAGDGLAVRTSFQRSP
jgi:transposase-like protein